MTVTVELGASFPLMYPYQGAHDESGPLGSPERQFPHAEHPGNVELRRDAKGEAWIVYPYAAPTDYCGGRGPLRLVAERLYFWDRGIWPGPSRVQCHTSDRTHPWNEGQSPQMHGHHSCLACGSPAWVESHGNAAGKCERCGHEG